ncbi:DUF2059 domain-containing protein [Pararoseomonas sp. SCSIO 73927]|uniref:DUF2059 domain-containing protein n=1 Tax=Pararoseomonas sp. SCSIO 73927 TaxID=3114537 RepID=UPI0030D0B14A
MSWSRTLLLAAALAIPALPGAAQTPPARPAPAAPAPAASTPAGDPEARAAARQLMDLTGATAMMDQVLAGMRPLLVQALRQQSPQVPQATVEKAVDEVLIPEFRARLPEAADATVDLYVRNFTAAELREVIAFYGTPVGRKLLQALPQLMQQSVAVGQAWGQRVAQEALTKHRAALRERGINL